ncbi:MAG TPA: hypothetical protein DCX07_10410 [Phycisphaerales bacterium]|nr:hypothetical protein [Phycisphaerales bacterium]
MERVNQAVAQAEARTGARIVPVLATVSGRYEWAEDMVGLWAAAVGLALTWAFLLVAPVGREWANEGKVYTLGLLPILAVVVCGFVVGALLATQVSWLRRLFVSRRKFAESVRQSAQQIFQESTVYWANEPHNALIVLYVSLYEKHAEIACDASLESRFANLAASLDGLIFASLRENRPTDGLCDALAQIAEALPAVAETNRALAPPGAPRQSTCLRVIG